MRAAKTPATRLYERLGFHFGALEPPGGYFDWDGGYSGSADARAIAAHLPPNADVSPLARREARAIQEPRMRYVVYGRSDAERAGCG